MNISKRNKRRGQTSVEYILIIAAVVGVIVLFGKNFKEKIGEVTGSLFGGVSKSISSMQGQ